MPPPAGSHTLADHAGALAATALQSLEREFPHAPAHTVLGAHDRALPRELHPAFHGAFDWHSAVHLHWLLVRLLRTHPERVDAVAVRRVLDDHLTVDALRSESGYLAANPGWERPYGWAWLLTLAAECAAWDDPGAHVWTIALRAPVDTVADLISRWRPRATYPVRDGGHANTAFSLGLVLDSTRTLGLPTLDDQVRDWALRHHLDDRDAPAAWEPSGHDFLSPSLAEADLLRRILDQEAFGRWLEGFLPGLADAEPARLLTPVRVVDRTDGLLGHLDGLNFSRSGALRALGTALPEDDPRRTVLLGAATKHLDAALPALAVEDFSSTHWLGTFAARALTTP